MKKKRYFVLIILFCFVSYLTCGDGQAGFLIPAEWRFLNPVIPSANANGDPYAINNFQIALNIQLSNASRANSQCNNIHQAFGWEQKSGRRDNFGDNRNYGNVAKKYFVKKKTFFFQQRTETSVIQDKW